MILLQKNTINAKIALTLHEKTTISNPVYLFELTNDLTNISYYFIASDSSNYPNRYNLFTIIETTSSPTPLTGKITLGKAGYYSYRIYEQSSLTNLNPAGLAIVETGKCLLQSSVTGATNYDQQTKTRKVYAK